MKKCVSAIILFIMFLPAFALGDESKYSKGFQVCLDRANGVTADTLECISEEKEIHDKRLNEAYKKLMKVLPDKRKKALQDAQRSWIKFRDDYAEFLVNPDGGTMAVAIRADWFLTSTFEQANHLEGQLMMITD